MARGTPGRIAFGFGILARTVLEILASLRESLRSVRNGAVFDNTDSGRNGIDSAELGNAAEICGMRFNIPVRPVERLPDAIQVWPPIAGSWGAVRLRNGGSRCLSGWSSSTCARLAVVRTGQGVPAGRLRITNS